MPFPSAKVIPDGWAAHHRPSMLTTMTTPATFFRVTGGPAPYPEPPGWTGLTAIWLTPVRVQALAVAPQQAEAALQAVTVRRYLVVAPLGGPALQVGQNADQVHVLGRVLRIVDIAPGSNLWEADITCEELLSQAGPVELEVDVGEQRDQ